MWSKEACREIQDRGHFEKILREKTRNSGCVIPEGFSEKARKHLRQKRDSANQIHKAAMAINCSILAEIEIPHTYITSLPVSLAASNFLNPKFSWFCK
ncbi:putative PRONE domain, Rop guanine nucleotide exchange factor [Helianthus anomalus]